MIPPHRKALIRTTPLKLSGVHGDAYDLALRKMEMTSYVGKKILMEYTEVIESSHYQDTQSPGTVFS